MKTQAIFYKSVVPISAERHGDAAVKTGGDYSFARDANAVPITAVEFPNAAREYAIVFAGDSDAIMPVVVLSPQQNCNRYVDSEGRWTGKYLPAFVRRYPFVFSASDDGNTLTLCIDEHFSGFNTEGRGERLFDSDGERTQFLNAALSFQQEYQAHFKATQAFCRKLRELGLLEPAEARFMSRAGRLHTLTGLLVVNRERVAGLSDEELGALVRSGELELLYQHLFSLHHLTTMGDHIADEDASAAGSASDLASAEDQADARDGDAGRSPADAAAPAGQRTRRARH